MFYFFCAKIQRTGKVHVDYSSYLELWPLWGDSEDPADGNPLLVCVESVQGPSEAAIRSVQVIVHYAQVKIVTVRPLDPFALVHGPFQF